MTNPEDIIDPTTAMNMALALMAKAFKLNYSTPTNNNQRISSNLKNRQIAQPVMNIGQDRQMQMVGGNGNQNQIGNGNLVAARAEGNAAGKNENQIRCYNCKGEEAGIQLQAEVYVLMAAAADLDEIEEVNANCILMANLRQASTSEEQYTELLKPIPESHQVPQNDNEVISEDTSVEQGGETVEQHPANLEETQTLQLAQESHDKMKQLNKEIKPANYTKINHLLGVFVPQTALSHEELYFSNNSKTANVSKSFLIPNEDLSNDTTPSVARKFLNEVKSTIVTLQRVVKQRMTIETHNWASSAHQELHKIVREEIFPIVNQVDARVQNFEIQFLKEAAKFVGDFKSLANEADASLAKHKALELEIKRLLKAFVSQDIMIIVQNESVVDTSDLQTELERTKERFENCVIKKETEYAKLWNDWYKKYTQNPLSQKLENKNVELEFQVLNYARENAHLKATYKNLFDSISALRAQTKTIIASLQNELQSNIYKNAKLRTQLFKKVSDQKEYTQDTSANTKFSKQPIVENLATNCGKSSQSWINPDKTSREAKKVPNTVKANARTKPITVSQPPVFTRKDVNSNSNGLSSTRVDNTKTRRPQSRSNTKNDRVFSTSKSSRSKNKEAKVKEHHRNLLLSKNNKHISSACNNIQIDSQDVISKIVYAMCSKCNNIQIDSQPKVTKPKKVEHHKSLATPKPRKPRFLLRWSPTGRLFDQEGKLATFSNSESQYDCSNGDNACTSNVMEPKIKRFPNSTSLLDKLFRFVYGASIRVVLSI
nr:hypothetical protein [Tanacetum cinerariifolium]